VCCPSPWHWLAMSRCAEAGRDGWVHTDWVAPVALVTALLVVSAGDISTTAEIIAWIVPAAVGVPLIVRAHTGARTRAR